MDVEVNSDAEQSNESRNPNLTYPNLNLVVIFACRSTVMDVEV
jgi:hypothetical protein